MVPRVLGEIVVGGGDDRRRICNVAFTASGESAVLLDGMDGWGKGRVRVLGLLRHAERGEKEDRRQDECEVREVHGVILFAVRARSCFFGGRRRLVISTRSIGVAITRSLEIATRG